MIKGVAETVLYADDVEACAAFYANVLGLELVKPPDEMFAAIRVTPESVVLLFNGDLSGRAGRDVPAHGTTGPGHVAFLVDNLDPWRKRLVAKGVEIEQEIEWEGGGRSIYVRDPANNSIELIDRDIWPTAPGR
jgi:catechol 2,3-dioxygenase-like lactoylglutathione lyase family enzyme